MQKFQILQTVKVAFYGSLCLAPITAISTLWYNHINQFLGSWSHNMNCLLH